MLVNLRILAAAAGIIGHLATPITAHFILQIPTSIGYDDTNEGIAPCGNFNASDRSKGVKTWPVGGSAIKVLTTHTSVTWEYKMALLSNTASWTSVTPLLYQSGVPYFCEPQIPAPAAWAGLDAVLQVIQHTSHGDLYQVSISRGHPTCKRIPFLAVRPRMHISY
jgi:hypothetical protein